MKAICRSIIPKRCRCQKYFKQTREEKMFEIARVKLESEVNLVEVIKMQRYIKLALKTIFNEKKR